MIRVWTTDSSDRQFGLVWGPEEWLYLRQTCRIVGSLVGTPGKASRQVEFSGLPMLLSAEEIDLLRKEQKIIICKLKKEFSEEYQNKFRLHMEITYQEQIALFREEREKEIYKMSDKIVKGKLQKHKDTSDLEVTILEGDDDPEVKRARILQSEIDKIPELPRRQALLQTFQGHPWINNDSDEVDDITENWKFSGDDARRLVFADLWKKGFFITDGSKFGGDFLAYPGDPIHLHAKYIVVCRSSIEITSASESDLVAHSRLATSTKKTVIFASIVTNEKSEKKIKYQAVKWNNYQ